MRWTLFSALCGLACVAKALVLRSGEPSSADFLHGVASGDPLPDAVVLWTRATPAGACADDVRVRWEVWPDQAPVGGASGNRSGEVLAVRSRDFTVKVDVTGLQPGAAYRFRFAAGAAASPVGRFRLPPRRGQRLPSLRYAIFSCSNFAAGYFGAYAHAAARDLDFWLHVGDYIYEYGTPPAEEPSEAQRARALDPPHELLTVEDYRRRHRLHRTDPDLQALSASAPAIAIWDDHEVTDNSWMHGAANHQSGQEGDFQARRSAALQAYHEWLPTRHGLSPEAEPMRWRAFDFGDLARLLVLETRYSARTVRPALTGEQLRALLLRAAARAPPPAQWPGSAFEGEMQRLRRLADESRSGESSRLLGHEQLEWIRQQVSSAPADGLRWSLVAQQLSQPLAPANFDEALRHASASADEGARRTAAAWAAALENATAEAAPGASPPSFLKEALQPGAAPRRLPLPSDARAQALALLAAGRYGITDSFDGWSGYQAERQRFLGALSASGDGSALRTVVYGGDSHNAWAGILRNASGEVFAHEFDGMSVSSPGEEERAPWLPSAFRAAAWKASNRDLAWADVRHRGFMLVTLAAEAHKVSYFGVDTTVPGVRGRPFCLASFATTRGSASLAQQPC